MRNYYTTPSKTFNVVISSSAGLSETRDTYKQVYKTLLRYFESPPSTMTNWLTTSELRVWKSLRRFIARERKHPKAGRNFVYINMNTGISVQFLVNGIIRKDDIVITSSNSSNYEGPLSSDWEPLSPNGRTTLIPEGEEPTFNLTKGVL